MKKLTPYIFIVILLGLLIWLYMNPKIVEKRVEVPVEKIKEVTKEIEVESKNIWITSEPSKAEIYLEGEKIGDTPFKIKWENKALSFEIKKDGFLSQKKEISTFTDIIEVKLVPSVVMVSFAVEPAGTEIWEGERLLGQSPLTGIKIKGGDYNLTFKKEGYQSLKKSYSFDKENTIVMETLTYPSIPASITSNIEGSDIYLDNEYVGKTPFEGNINPNNKKLLIKKDGFLPYEELLSLTNDMTLEKNINLKEIPAKLTVMALDSQIFINGTLAGEKQVIKELASGEYNIVVKRNGYVDRSEKIYLSKGDSQVLYLTPMEPILTEPKEIMITQKNPWRPSTRLGIAGALLLAGGGVLLNDKMIDAQDKYDSAISNSDAKAYRDDVNSYESYRNTMYYLSSGAVGWSLFSWYMERKWDKKHQVRGE